MGLARPLVLASLGHSLASSYGWGPVNICPFRLWVQFHSSSYHLHIACTLPWWILSFASQEARFVLP